MSTLLVDGLTVEVAGVENPAWDRPRGPQRRGPRRDGPERGGQEHARPRPDGPSRLHRHRRIDHAGRDRPARPGHLGACRARPVLAPQYPVELPGVRALDVLVEALFTRRGGSDPDRAALAARTTAEAAEIGLAAEFTRGLQRRRLRRGEEAVETLQLAVLEPAIAILDELDSGLDVDALRDVARRVERAVRPGSGGPAGREPLGVLAITHYSRLLEELHPDRVHVLYQGRIVESGGPELAEELERTGYQRYGEEPAG